jgi:hypothetical protein
MSEDKGSFAAHLGDLDEIAGRLLPTAAAALRAPIGVIAANEGFTGPGTLASVPGMQASYENFTYNLANRQSTAAQRVDETAQALKEIVEVYRRTDGAQ